MWRNKPINNKWKSADSSLPWFLWYSSTHQSPLWQLEFQVAVIDYNVFCEVSLTYGRFTTIGSRPIKYWGKRISWNTLYLQRGREGDVSTWGVVFMYFKAQKINKIHVENERRKLPCRNKSGVIIRSWNCVSVFPRLFVSHIVWDFLGFIKLRTKKYDIGFLQI